MTLSLKSIRWRFVFWLAFLLSCILTGFGVTAYQLHRINQFDQFDEELNRRVAALSSTLRAPPLPRNQGERPPFDNRAPGPPRPSGPPRNPPSPGGPPDFSSPARDVHISTEAAALFDENAADGFYFTLWSRDGGAVLKRSANAPPGLPRPARPGKDTGLRARARDDFREAYHYTERGDCVLVGKSTLSIRAATRRFAGWLLAGGAAVLALGLGGGWLIAGRALGPVREISAAASRISAGNLSERINLSRTDSELGQLARTLNGAFASLEAAFAQQKQFTADASHELRTPIAVLISEAQIMLARDRTPDEYREALAACLGVAQQMRRLAESLLELARLDAEHETLPRKKFNLAAVARDCLEQIRPLAAEKRVAIQAQLPETVCLGDPESLARVVTNLLANAIQYNVTGGGIRLATRNENGATVLSVADTGVGIPAADLPRVFERFYRAGQSGRADGHAGLGLAICKGIIDAHRGQIEISSIPGAGATVTVRLPCD
jgi:heavy metal sensor kinase